MKTQQQKHFKAHNKVPPEICSSEESINKKLRVKMEENYLFKV